MVKITIFLGQFICLEMFLGMCSSNWNTIPFKEGTYLTSDYIEFGDFSFEEIRLDLTEISYQEYKDSKINVLLDYATPRSERLYYQINLILTLLDEESIVCKLTFDHRNPSSGEGTYIYNCEFEYLEEVFSFRVGIMLLNSDNIEMFFTSEMGNADFELILQEDTEIEDE